MKVEDNSGEFWIDDKSIKKTGTINISDNHLVNIRVNGAIFTGKLTSLHMSHDVINGYIYTGDYIKILDPYSYRGFGFKEEHSHEKYSGSVYATSKFEIPDNPSFTKIRWALDGLDRWLGINPYSVEEINEKKFYVDCILPEEVAAWNTKIGKIRLLSDYSVKRDGNKYELKNSFYLEIEFPEPKELQDCFSLAQNVERFFVTFVNKNNLLPLPSVFREDEETNLFYQTYNYEKGHDTKWYASSFPLMKDNFGTYLSNYIELAPDYLAGFFGYPASFSKGLFIQNRFSQLVTGLEALHTCRYGRYKEAEDRDSDIEKFVAKLRDCTTFNSPERSSLKYFFKERYKYSLRERLVKLVEELDFLDLTAGKIIMKDVSDVRNELMHSGSLKKGSSFSTGTIVRFNYILEMISVLSIMLVTGMEKDIISKIYIDGLFFHHPRVLYESYSKKK